MATLADIAKASGVSTAVVSRVINKDKKLRISDETRKRVLKAIEELDYTPNIAARTLRSAKSGMIALVMHDVTNPVHAEIVRGAQHATERSKKSIILFDASTSTDGTTPLIEMIGGAGIDGLILQSSGGIADNILAKAAKSQVPIILLQAELDIEAHMICLPDEKATRMATKHLIDQGHKDIGCIASGKGLTFTVNRMMGWQAEMALAGLSISDDQFLYCKPNIEDGVKQTARLLDKNPDLTAIVSFNIMIAIGALQEIEARGLKVPDDISLITIHDIKLANFLKTPLTTIEMPLFELGQRAVEIITNLKHIGGGHSTIEKPEPRLVLRSSTANPPVK